MSPSTLRRAAGAALALALPLGVLPAAGAAVGTAPTHARTAAAPSALSRQVDATVRCVSFEGVTPRYCLGVGWTTSSQAQVRARVLAAAQRPVTGEQTGEQSMAKLVAQRSAMSAPARARLERSELAEARKAAPKVAGIYADAARGVDAARYPGTRYILKQKKVHEQIRSDYCGPTTMQMIYVNYPGKGFVSQNTTAGWVGWTDNGGTGITGLVSAVNRHTGWDKPKYAGTYASYDVSGWSYATWHSYFVKHIAKYRAPVVLHPQLLKKYFPYLDDNGSGHFQVGRGYIQKKSGPDVIGYFEPWNQQRFDPSEPYIKRLQNRKMILSYRANQAHSYPTMGL